LRPETNSGYQTYGSHYWGREQLKKNIYYSPVYFQPVKEKKVLSTIIAPIGKTIQKGNKDYDI
jgi:hypothetical protein